jgi:hypothetical protein
MFCTSSQDGSREIGGEHLVRWVLEMVRVKASTVTVPGPPKLPRPDRPILSSEFSTVGSLGLP